MTNHKEMSAKSIKDICESIFIQSKLVLMHANDLLDHRIIQTGTFIPAYTHDSVLNAVDEIVQIARFTVGRKNIIIKKVY